MKKEKIIMLSVLVLVMIGFGVFKYYSNSSGGLCIYEIPNHIKMKCGEGNSTRTVNFFEATLFKYENALSQGCIPFEELDEFGYRYEIAKCNESIGFDVFN